METYISIFKIAGSIISIIMGMFKLFNRDRPNREHPSEDKVSLLKSFVDENKIIQNQLYVEYLFTYIYGHKKLNAIEISYLINTDNPTQTIDRYINSKSYITIDNKDSQILLKKPFKKISSLKFFRIILFIIYTIFSIIALLFIFYIVPAFISSNNWPHTFTASLLCLVFGYFSIMSVLEARRISDALSLLSEPISSLKGSEPF
jgi:hypothetical protein